MDPNLIDTYLHFTKDHNCQENQNKNYNLSIFQNSVVKKRSLFNIFLI